VRSRSGIAPGVAACPLALELRDLLLPVQPGPDAQTQGHASGDMRKPKQTPPN